MVIDADGDTIEVSRGETNKLKEPIVIVQIKEKGLYASVVLTREQTREVIGLLQAELDVD